MTPADAAPPTADPVAPTGTPEVLQLTAFAATPFGGNPAGVVLDASGLDDTGMQALATRLGHPETAFVVDPAVGGDPRHVRVRYFSPGAEVPFCGHATVATAVALAERLGSGPLLFDTAVGPVTLETRGGADHAGTVGGEGRGGVARASGPVTASFTSVDPVVRELDAELADRLLTLLGLGRDDLDERWPLREAYAGNRHPVVAVRERTTFDRFGFDPAALRALMDEAGWAGTVTVVHREQGPEARPAPDRPAPPLVVQARNLFPVGTITEDPATGSAAASLGGYLRALGLVTTPARVVVHQGEHVERPSVLVVDVPAAGGITVTGTATPYLG